jgi:hypothetical protein
MRNAKAMTPIGIRMPLLFAATLAGCAPANLAGPNATTAILKGAPPSSAAQRSRACINLDGEIDRQQDIARQGATDTSMLPEARAAIADASARNITALQAKGVDLKCGATSP